MPVRRRAGLSVSIARALATLAFIAILYTFTSEIWSRLTSTAREHVTGQTATKGFQHTETVHDNFLFIILAVTVLGMLAYAVYSSGPGGA